MDKTTYKTSGVNGDDLNVNHAAEQPVLTTLRGFPFIIREIIAGGIAGATAKTCVAPLERCKILYQTGKLHSAGITSTLRSIFQTEGIPGLFRGNGASILRIIPYSSIHFSLYEHYRRILVETVYSTTDSHGISPLVDLVAGSSAGATAVIVTYPLDLVRTRLAYMTEATGARSNGGVGNNKNESSKTVAMARNHISSHHHRHSIRSIITNTIQHEGLRGLYHGIGPSIYGILPYAGLKFFVYQHLKQFYLDVVGRPEPMSNNYEDSASTASSSNSIDNNSNDNSNNNRVQNRLPVPIMLLFGGVAGLIAQTTTYPLDVVRRRMQVEGLKYTSAASGGTSIPSMQSMALPKDTILMHHRPNEMKTMRLPASTPAALLAIARNEGWKVLFSGLSINYMKVVPSTAIGFTLYDYFKSALNLPTHL